MNSSLISKCRLSCAFFSLSSLLYYPSPRVGHRQQGLKTLGNFLQVLNFASEMHALYFETPVSKREPICSRLAEASGVPAQSGDPHRHRRSVVRWKHRASTAPSG